ncbi:CT398-like coiled coil hairpin domain-containing protein, partial [Mycobacterium intracellulare]|uniref:CT398-like coiled coil hairpin domain-containing protein n=1 Tax=Mycobacterium intracellulare TaxID=1767 RepID=UPI00403295A3
EELQSQLDTEQKALDTLEAEMAGARKALDAALAELTEARELHSSQRDSLSAALDPALPRRAAVRRARTGPG